MEIRIYVEEEELKPLYATNGSGCFDIRTKEDVTIEPGEIRLVGTGLYVQVPLGHIMSIRPRSGLATKGLTIVNSPGTVDSDYRGEVKIILHNLGKEPITLEKYSRVAQALVEKAITVEPVYVSSKEDLAPTKRGEGGFGSTGVK